MATRARDSRGRFLTDQHVRATDGLANVVSGAGTAADKRTYARHYVTPVDREEIAAAYRSSWLMRKIVDLPPFDMTRAWRDWQADKDQIEKLEAEERRLGLRQKVREALVLGRLGGGAIIIGAPGNSALPLNLNALGIGGVTYLCVLSRWQLSTGDLVMDPADPLFGQPRYFEITSGSARTRIHPTRVIAFRGLQVPAVGFTSDRDACFWGDPVLMSVRDAVNNATRSQDGFASLIEEAKLDIIGIPGLTEMAASAEYEANLTKRLQTSQLFKSQFNMLLTDSGNGQQGSGETWESRQVTWAGMPDIIATYLGIVAGAADIPATRLLGKSPDGMNASGEGDEANYWTMISARQESDLRPAMERLDEALIRSALGTSPPDVGWSFAPLRTLTEKEAADVAKVKADTITAYVNSGLLPTEALEKSVQNMLVEDQWLPGLDGALAEIPLEQRFPSRSEPDGNDEDPSELTQQSMKVAANDGRENLPKNV